MHGWMILDKPEGLSSARAVARVRTSLQVRKAGHAGTLDPLASGILPIAIGEATKTVQLIMEADKEYRFSIGWGVSTTTLDAAGQIVARSSKRPNPDQIQQVLNRLVGRIHQRPPHHSAIKINGKRACDLTRAGTPPDLQPRPVTLFEAEVIDAPSPDSTIIGIRCGKGFYVRALARDLAQELAAQAHVTALRRTRVGCFSLNDAKTLEMIAQMRDKESQQDCLIPILQALDTVNIVETSGEDSSSLRHGRHIAIVAAKIRHGSRQIGKSGHLERLALAVEANTPIALGQIRGDRFHPTRVFGLTECPDPGDTR